MDRHDIAHYAMALGLSAAAVAPLVIPAAGRLDLTGLAPATIELYCIESQYPKCATLAKDFKRAGWRVADDIALTANKGVGVKGSAELANRVGRALGVTPLRVASDSAQVWIGTPND